MFPEDEGVCLHMMGSSAMGNVFGSVGIVEIEHQTV